MPIERDPESTSFDARPWGGQQRLVPLAARFARGTDAPTPENAALLAASAEPAVTRSLTAASVPAPLGGRAAKRPATVPAPIAKHLTTAPTVESSDSFRSRPTLDSLPMTRVSNPIELVTETACPSLDKPSIIGALVEPMAMPMLTPVPGTLPPAPSTSLPTVAMRAADVPTDLNPAQPTFAPVVRYPAVAMHSPALAVSPAVARSSSKHAPRAIPAYSVKHGRALAGFVVPHLPRIAEVFRNEDATIAVRRRPLTTRSILAIPVGAVIATVAILMIYLAQPAQATTARPLGASAIASQPHVMKTTIAEPPIVMHTVAVQAAPVAAAPTVEPIVELAAPVVEVIAAPAVDAIEKTESRTSSHRRHRTHRKHRKPHRIVAVDASTPLGNLRPGR